MISNAKYEKFMGKPRAVQDPAEAEAGRVQQLARNAATHQVREERAAPIRAAINQAHNQIMTDTKASGLKGQALADARAQALSAARTANRAQMPARVAVPPTPPPPMQDTRISPDVPMVAPPPPMQDTRVSPDVPMVAPPPPTPQVAPTRQPDDTGFEQRTTPMKRGGAVKKMASGGMTSKVSSASKRGDGIAQRGKTKGRYL